MTVFLTEALYQSIFPELNLMIGMQLTQQNICCKKLLHYTVQDVGLKLLLLGSGGALW